ncbi:guanylate-binding n-terminal domain containing protein [Stylonychia lemnae]|uniref:Guanylate-binding n-terminal domain containing protein n=1 Tax=Stylonychia lemnae TaxID=5949 RepID=A0A078A8F9_STYLE|nr:guanylate-binding n-terminal domain containing protein [Stylonychia lemnae]|eukprot:CDW77066.1 guanylate-binding n-terminal domain containing protein [Stylonychia lemnae]
MNSNSEILELQSQAIPLVSFDSKTQKFSLNPDAVEIIHTKFMNGPLKIISVIGMYRTGKSFLLNQLINQSSPTNIALDSSSVNQFKRNGSLIQKQASGFQTCDTINSCTKGLWMWSEPANALSNSNEQVLLIDTEGLGSLEEDSNHDAKIFALALMVSSLIVYNSVGSIDDEAIQRLGLVIKLSKYVDLDELRQTPRLLWLLRDFSLQLQNEQKEEITANQYLQLALKDQKGISETIMNKNRIKKDFKDQLEQLKVQIRKSESSQIMKNGKIFTSLLQECCDALNGGRFPRLKTTWDYIVQEENQKLMSETIMKYQSQILYEGTDDESEGILTVDELIDSYFSKCYGLDDPAQIRFYEKQLRSELQKVKKETKFVKKQQQQSKLEQRWQQISYLLDKDCKDVYLNLNQDEIALKINTYLANELQIPSLDFNMTILQQIWSSLLGVQLQQQRDDSLQFQQQIRNLKETLFQKEKDQAILNQKIEFLSLELEERKKEKQQFNQIQEKLIHSLQNQETPSKYRMELETQRHQETMKIQQLEHEFMSQLKDLEQMNDDLKHELQLKTETIRHYETSQKDGLQLSKKEYQELTRQRDVLSDKVKELEKKNYEQLLENQKGLERIRSEKENEMQEIERQYQREMDQIREKAENSLHQLKQFYVVEKQTIEQKLVDEKQKNSQRASFYEQEMLSKLKQEQQQKDEVLEWLEIEMKDQEIEQKARINNLEQDQLLYQQKITTLEKCLNETKQNLNQIYSFNSELINQQMERFNQERSYMIEKLERLQSEVREKERDYLNSESQKSRLIEQLTLIQKEYSVFKQKIGITEENQRIMKDDFDDEISQYKYTLGEYQKQLEIMQDKYKLLENYTEDLKDQINRQKQEHVHELDLKKLKVKEWKNKYEQYIQKQNEERLKAKPDNKFFVQDNKENIQLPNGMTPQQMFKATQDDRSFIPEHIYIKIRNIEKNKDGNISKYELEINDNQSANKYVITRSVHQIFGLFLRIQDYFNDQQLGNIDELKKMLLGQTDKYCSEEVKKLSLQHYLNEIYRDTEKVSQSSELKAFLQLHKFCGLKNPNHINQSQGPSISNNQDLIQALGITQSSMIQNSIDNIGMSDSQSFVSKISMANSQSQFTTFESIGPSNIQANKRYDQIQTNGKIDYQELDRLLSNKNTTNLFR